MSTYTELIMKLADGKPLDPIEKEQLRQYTQEIDSNRNFVSAFQNIDGKIKNSFVNFPISTIYSSVLPADASTINVPIPSTYTHLILVGGGKSTSASPDAATMRFNGDSGSNYSYQYMQMASTTVSGGQNLSLDSAILGDIIDTADDTLSASFFTIIPHYRSTYYKVAMTMTNYRNASFRYVKLRNSYWNSQSPITSIDVFAFGGNLKSGFALSVYGLA